MRTLILWQQKIISTWICETEFVLVRWHLEIANSASGFLKSNVWLCCIGCWLWTAMCQVMNNWNRKIFLVIDGEREKLRNISISGCMRVFLFMKLSCFLSTHMASGILGIVTSRVAHKTPLLRRSNRLWCHIVYTCLSLPGQPPETLTAENGCFQQSVVASGPPIHLCR